MSRSRPSVSLTDFLIRPIAMNDLDQFVELVHTAGPGLTSLPKDHQLLEARIQHSERSFAHRVAQRPQGESYLFVLEDTQQKRIAGVSGIISKIGGFEPFYFYKIHQTTHHSESLKLDNQVTTLHVEAVHNRPAEICSLYLHPDYRMAKVGRFLSLSRFLFFAENRPYFENEVIAEMRGQVKENGESPFWEAVGRKFFKMDFQEADLLTLRSKAFIDELLPKYPIIVDLLPPEARDVVGKVHNQTGPAKRILETQGFTASGYVGIFEPGPVLKVKLDDIKIIREARSVEISIKPLSDSGQENLLWMVSFQRPDFRAFLCHGQLNGETLEIDPEQANLLELADKTLVRAWPFAGP